MRNSFVSICILAVLMVAGCANKSPGESNAVNKPAQNFSADHAADSSSSPVVGTDGQAAPKDGDPGVDPSVPGKDSEIELLAGVQDLRDVSPLRLFGEAFFAGATGEELAGLGIPLGIPYRELRMNHGEPEDKDSWGGGAYAKYFGSVFFIDAFDFSDSGELEFADPGAVHIGWYKVPDASRLMVRDFFTVLGEPADLYRNGEDGVYDESWNFSYGVLEQGDVRFELHIIADGTNRNSRVTMIELRVAQDDPDVDAADGDDEGEGDPGDEDSQAVPVNEIEDLPDEQP